ncbi:MAG TPA: 16S rRNA (cytidine(1402)-2'-O)-methyltransferase [Acidimicrobiales bacterium]|nr:16S rRNA (cytidine(1402)-2'-O)-methyltransferase [Acidimicrobiales bacterium]
MTGGVLVLIGTPIGNLGDLPPRAVQELERADLIACEDTRRTRRLMSHAGVPATNRLITVNDHNEATQVRVVIERLDAGARVAVVTDAGMPGISDPGERLVAATVAAGHRVLVVPGPSAALAALVMSGLPAGRFCFEGFLPRKGRARADRMNELAIDRRTTVIFEAPHRVRRTVADLTEALGGERLVFIAREITKLYEESWRGLLANAAEYLEKSEPRGEYVLVVGGAPAPSQPDDDDVAEALRARLGAGVDRKTAVSTVAKELNVPRRSVYELAIHLEERP